MVLKHSAYFLLAWLVFLISCSKSVVDKKVDCSVSGLAISLLTKTNTAGCQSTDGRLVVSTTGGKEPYNYNLNGGKSQPNNEFVNLSSGRYTVGVKDANGCEASVEIDIASANSTVDATIVTVKNNQCNNPNGSITVSPTGGAAPYAFLLGISGFVTNNVFTNLKEGTYSILIKDANECIKTVSAIVSHGDTGTSYLNDIAPIITTNCNLVNCHDANSGVRNWTTYQNVKDHSSNIKTRTSDKSMPLGRTLTQSQINLIACWVDDGAPQN